LDRVIRSRLSYIPVPLSVLLSFIICPRKLSPYNLARPRIILNPNMFHNMTQNASFPPNITTMEDLPKDDNFPNFQSGLELFNDTELPPSLRSSYLALVSEQEIRSNPPTLSAHPSPNKKRLLDQLLYIHGLHAFSTSQKQPAVGHLTRLILNPNTSWNPHFTFPIASWCQLFLSVSLPNPPHCRTYPHNILHVPTSKIYAGISHHPDPRFEHRV
jgi:hypothetical protein